MFRWSCKICAFRPRTTGTKMKINVVIAGVIAAAAATGTGASAALLDPIYESEVDSTYTVCPFNAPGGVNCPSSISITTDGLVSGPNGGSASVFASPNPTLTARANASDLNNVNVQISQASVTYYFSIIGADTGVYIPVDLTYSASATSDRTGSQAEVIVSMGGYNSQGGGGVLYDPGIGTMFAGGTVTSNVYANASTPINLGAIAIAEVNLGDSDSAYTQLDPVLSIDPSFSLVDPNYLTDYSIAFSPGIDNLPDAIPDAVPEPATWLLSILGLGGTGVMLRRRRSRAQDQQGRSRAARA